MSEDADYENALSESLGSGWIGCSFKLVNAFDTFSYLLAALSDQINHIMRNFLIVSGWMMRRPRFLDTHFIFLLIFFSLILGGFGIELKCRISTFWMESINVDWVIDENSNDWAAELRCSIFCCRKMSFCVPLSLVYIYFRRAFSLVGS